MNRRKIFIKAIKEDLLFRINSFYKRSDPKYVRESEVTESKYNNYYNYIQKRKRITHKRHFNDKHAHARQLEAVMENVPCIS